MMLTKKHFNAMQKAFAEEYMAIMHSSFGKELENALVGFNAAVNAYCNVAIADNPRFDRKRFWKGIYG